MFFLQIDLSTLTNDLGLVSSVAITLGAVFVVFQLRQNNKLIRHSAAQAEATSIQAKLTTEQLKQNGELANMDMVMRLYEFANTTEVQDSWITVINSKITSFEELEELPRQQQIAFYQIAALFESLGVLVERNFVKPDIIDDMFATDLAWKKLKPFVNGMRERYGEAGNYVYFETLYQKLTSPKMTGQR
jgi:hypothetical protein